MEVGFKQKEKTVSEQYEESLCQESAAGFPTVTGKMKFRDL